ncbi:transcription antitermination factor NusB [candidate division CSSED10-310 bacterium]|uniref:Transcription antitermination protein NusB n=1 Tax=candidate division CSSED10-310 bacterium TaxID=2855610 RepID=A0ABV6YSP8_UNCC1
MGTRRIARELALQILYQKEIGQENLGQILTSLRQNSDKKFSTEVWNYAQQLASGALENQANIDELIAQYSDHWELSRICLIDRNILRLAIYEMLYSPETVPPNVCINEALEIAKKFSSHLSPAFINGILDKVKAHAFKGTLS